jgi:hypothetical protein
VKRGVAAIAITTFATSAACRFGGPSADPNAYVSFPTDATATDGAEDASMSEALDAPESIDGTARVDAPADDAPADDASAGEGGSDAPSTDGHAACASAIAVCDPIHDTGCNALQQCDVDLTQATTPTGACVFNSAQSDGGPCTVSVLSESCPPRFTCIASACHALCACDSDCPPTTCCSDTGGPPGFRLCQPCP